MMKQIDTRQWKEFIIKDIFITEKQGKNCQVPTGAYIEKKSLLNGNIPRITVMGTNNGICGYYANKIDDKNYRIYENFISVSFLGTVFYQKEQASLDMKVHCLKPINIELNEYTGLFLVTAIGKSLKTSTYSDQISSKVLAGLSIKLPVDETGNPDFSYMELYMKNLEFAVSSSLTDLQSAKKFDISGELDISSWKLFQISELFNVQKGKRLTKSDMKDGKIRFIGASAINNGITAYISNDEHLHPQNTITLSYNGSIGEAFYQDEMFWASDDVNVLYPKFEMNREMAFFIIPLLKTAGKKYAFIDKWKKEDMEKSKIPLPVDKDGNPDYKYMENYIVNKFDMIKIYLTNLVTSI